MELNWLGLPTNRSRACRVWTVIAVLTSTVSLASLIDFDDPEDFDSIGIFPFLSPLGLLTLIVVTCLRKRVREKYDIPADCLGATEDFWSSFFCTSCTICQIARHTADYDAQEAACCTGTGLVSETDSVV